MPWIYYKQVDVIAKKLLMVDVNHCEPHTTVEAAVLFVL